MRGVCEGLAEKRDSDPNFKYFLCVQSGDEWLQQQYRQEFKNAYLLNLESQCMREFPISVISSRRKS